MKRRMKSLFISSLVLCIACSLVTIISFIAWFIIGLSSGDIISGYNHASPLQKILQGICLSIPFIAWIGAATVKKKQKKEDAAILFYTGAFIPYIILLLVYIYFTM
jgi:hypothetical protein